MEYILTAKKGKPTKTMKEAVEERFSKLEKFLKEDEPVKVSYETFKDQKIRLKAQVVLKDNYHLKNENDGYDFYEVLVALRDSTLNCINKRKVKANSKSRSVRQIYKEQVPEETAPVIKKVKTFELDSITVGMAINEMEKLGHDSYLFKNIEEDDKVCMVYRRVDDDFSMIIIDN